MSSCNYQKTSSPDSKRCKLKKVTKNIIKKNRDSKKSSIKNLPPMINTDVFLEKTDKIRDIENKVFSDSPTKVDDAKIMKRCSDTTNIGQSYDIRPRSRTIEKCILQEQFSYADSKIIVNSCLQFLKSTISVNGFDSVGYDFQRNVSEIENVLNNINRYLIQQ